MAARVFRAAHVVCVASIGSLVTNMYCRIEPLTLCCHLCWLLGLPSCRDREKERERRRDRDGGSSKRRDSAQDPVIAEANAMRAKLGLKPLRG